MAERPGDYSALKDCKPPRSPNLDPTSITELRRSRGIGPDLDKSAVLWRSSGECLDLSRASPQDVEDFIFSKNPKNPGSSERLSPITVNGKPVTINGETVYPKYTPHFEYFSKPDRYQYQYMQALGNPGQAYEIMNNNKKMMPSGQPRQRPPRPPKAVSQHEGGQGAAHAQAAGPQSLDEAIGQGLKTIERGVRGLLNFR